MCWFLAAVFAASLRGQLLSPNVEFDLNSSGKLPHHDQRTRVYFMANASGLTLLTINEEVVSLIAADLDGRIIHSRSDIASVHAQIYAALPRPDGSVWIVSAGPQAFGGMSPIGNARPVGGTNNPTYYQQLDLYSRSGEHRESLRIVNLVLGSEVPLAATDDELVLSTGGAPHFRSPDQFIRFGTVEAGRFKERTQVRLTPPIYGAIPVITQDGDLLLVNKRSGNMAVIDPKTKVGSVTPLAKPQLIRAAATDAKFIYLLSSDSVVKIDRTGEVFSEYRFQFEHGFVPVAIAVTGHWLYLVERSGHALRYLLD